MEKKGEKRNAGKGESRQRGYSLTCDSRATCGAIN